MRPSPAAAMHASPWLQRLIQRHKFRCDHSISFQARAAAAAEGGAPPTQRGGRAAARVVAQAAALLKLASRLVGA